MKVEVIDYYDYYGGDIDSRNFKLVVTSEVQEPPKFKEDLEIKPFKVTLSEYSTLTEKQKCFSLEDQAPIAEDTNGDKISIELKSVPVFVGTTIDNDKLYATLCLIDTPDIGEHII